MPHNQTVIDALCQVVSRYLPPPLQSVLDALMERLQEQRIHAGSNKEEQTYIDFFRVCKHLHESVHLDTAAGICQRLRHSATRLAGPQDQGTAARWWWRQKRRHAVQRQGALHSRLVQLSQEVSGSGAGV